MHCLVYDVPAERREVYAKLAHKDPKELTDSEKKQIEHQRQILRLRQGIAAEAATIGSMINYSVCLLPVENLEKAKSLKNKYEAEYKKIQERVEIYLLTFHPKSTLILKKKAQENLKKRLNKMLDTMDKIQQQILQKKKKGITRGELKKIGETLEEVDELAKKFKIDDEMSDILKIATERVKGVEAA